MNRDELCIIEDHTDGGECSDLDDDEACESKENNLVLHFQIMWMFKRHLILLVGGQNDRIGHLDLQDRN
jgi:hypothetical protein